jgi:hypothetical protein
MAEAKTQKTKASVSAFLAKAVSGERRADAKKLVRIMSAVTGDRAAMWGPSIVGFGSYTYSYASGRTGDWPLAAFAPRKPATVVYIMPGFKKYDALVKKLGKCKVGASCIYIKSLADVDLDVLTELIAECAAHTREKHKAK